MKKRLSKSKGKKAKQSQVVVVEKQVVQRAPKSRENRSALGKAGATVGGFIGDAASYIGKIFGMGAYTIEKNVLYDARTESVTPPPLFTTTTDGSIYVCAREFIGDVTGSTLFTLAVNQNINPANRALFPRLSQNAPNYEEYEFLGLVFEFNSTSGTAVGSTNTALGTVIMTTQYDALDPLFNNKIQMESYMFSTSNVPCLSKIHPVECKRGGAPIRNLYVGDPSFYSTFEGAYPANADPRMYDYGKFSLATVGQQAANVMGELWVSYCVKFTVPKYNQSMAIAHIVSSSNTGTAAAPLTAAVLSAGSDLPVSFTNTTFTIPSIGFYEIVLVMTGSDIGSGPGFSLGTNIVNTNGFDGYTSSSQNGFASTGSNAFSATTVQVKANGTGSANTITISGMSSLTAGNVDIYILRRYAISGVVTTGF